MTRADGEELIELLRTLEVKTVVETFPLEQAEAALAKLRAGKIRGAAVLAVQWWLRLGVRA